MPHSAPRTPGVPGNPGIADRTALIDQLSVACELEQGLCIQYLFSAFSLKDDAAEGLSGEALTVVRKWKGMILMIAAQEMLHLAQAANLLAAIGGTVQLRRPNFPQSRGYYPTGLPWGLLPFTRDTIRLYACYERPAEVRPELRQLLGNFHFDEAALFHEDAAHWSGKVHSRATLPARYAEQRERSTSFETIGALYEAIGRAFGDLDLPKSPLFIGSPLAQVEGDMIDFPQLHKIADTQGANAAIDLIVKQGEGGPHDRPDSHFGLFVRILREYDELEARDPEFAPARDVHPNPLSRLHVDNTYPGWRLIDDAFTREVNDLTTDVYQAMMLALYRFFATTDNAADGRRHLARTALYAMTTVVKPLGEAMTRLPMGGPPSGPGDARPTRAGASFEIDRAIQLMPDSSSSWHYLRERLGQLAERAAVLADRALGQPAYASAAPELASAAATLRQLSQDFYLARYGAPGDAA